MLTAGWLAKHSPLWARLETLLERGGPRLRKLPPEELAEFGGLYRQAAADLARLRSDPAGGAWAEPLNRLLGRAHNVLYAAPRGGPGQVARWYAHEYPRVLRRALGCLALAFAVFAAGAVAGVVATQRDPGFAERMLGSENVAGLRQHHLWTQSIVGLAPVASSGILANNLTVTFAAFAMGMTAGLGTLYAMFFNGLLLGTVGAAGAAYGMSLAVWSFVAPHGALELPAIWIGGAAGLKLAQGLLFPGEWARGVALRRRGGDAVRLVLGVIPLLLVAAVLEGFVSPSPLPAGLKFAVGATLFSLLAVGLLHGAIRAGRVP